MIINESLYTIDGIIHDFKLFDVTNDEKIKSFIIEQLKNNCLPKENKIDYFYQFQSHTQFETRLIMPISVMRRGMLERVERIPIDYRDFTFKLKDLYISVYFAFIHLSEYFELTTRNHGEPYCLINNLIKIRKFENRVSTII